MAFIRRCKFTAFLHFLPNNLTILPLFSSLRVPATAPAAPATTGPIPTTTAPRAPTDRPGAWGPAARPADHPVGTCTAARRAATAPLAPTGARPARREARPVPRARQGLPDPRADTVTKVTSLS